MFNYLPSLPRIAGLILGISSRWRCLRAPMR